MKGGFTPVFKKQQRCSFFKKIPAKMYGRPGAKPGKGRMRDSP
jgi:hypothetical protein